MKLSSLLSGIDTLAIRGSIDIDICGIAYDSREVDSKYLFLAQKGVHVDGHEFIDAAIKKGAHAIIHGDEMASYREGVTYIRVQHPRRVLSPIAAAYYQTPSKDLICIGVTGTNGKSTTAFFIYQLLMKLNIRVGLLTTTSQDIGHGLAKNPMRKSTADASEVQNSLHLMVKNGLTHAVIEATSHGLAEETNRLGDVCFDVGVFTNITHEHLNFHGTFEGYLDAKANLFRALDGTTGGFGIVNSEDPHSESMASAAAAPVYTYGLDHRGDLSVFHVRESGSRFGFDVELSDQRAHATLGVPGRFNIENAVAATLTICKLFPEKALSDITLLLGTLVAPVGRMRKIDLNQNFGVFVDYAHSPDSFRKILPYFRSITRGRLIVVFGSAGEGDVDKRPEQGQIAAEYSDIVILTNEDPRSEDPVRILEDIAMGCASLLRDTTLFLIANRRNAIFKAIGMAGEGDTVLLLGKGHESTIELHDETIDWNEEEVAKEAIASHR